MANVRANVLLETQTPRKFRLTNINIYIVMVSIYIQARILIDKQAISTLMLCALHMYICSLNHIGTHKVKRFIGAINKNIDKHIRRASDECAPYRTMDLAGFMLVHKTVRLLLGSSLLSIYPRASETRTCIANGGTKVSRRLGFYCLIMLAI